jgi:hypothetical protein
MIRTAGRGAMQAPGTGGPEDGIYMQRRLILKTIMISTRDLSSLYLRLNPEISIADLRADVLEIGYPADGSLDRDA